MLRPLGRPALLAALGQVLGARHADYPALRHRARPQGPDRPLLQRLRRPSHPEQRRQPGGRQETLGDE